MEQTLGAQALSRWRNKVAKNQGSNLTILKANPSVAFDLTQEHCNIATITLKSQQIALFLQEAVKTKYFKTQARYQRQILI